MMFFPADLFSSDGDGPGGVAGSAPAVLAVGWEGTLAPDSGAEGAAALPREIAEAVELLLREAEISVGSMRSGGGLRFEEGEAPVEQLLPALLRRVVGVYAPVMAMRGDEPAQEEKAGADRVARALKEDWVAGMQLFLMRLEAESRRLARWLGVRELPAIHSLKATASDVHGAAGAVIEIGLAGGRTIFYKPRPVTGELLWAELNSLLAEFDPASAVTPARVLAGDTRLSGEAGAGFGWMEGLRIGACEERTHWRKAGTLLCLAQHAGLGDLQMSNVMATSGGPAVLDAECLGRPGSMPDTDELEASMIATGLLPRAIAAISEGGGLPDVSGLFGGGADVEGLLVPYYGEVKERRPAVAFVRARLLEQANRPRLKRQPLACLPEMLEGYFDAARGLISIRSGLLAKGGWLDRLGAQHGPRVVLRSTLSYGIAMSRSLFPGVVASDEARRQMLRRWLEETACASAPARRSEVVKVEVEMLLRLCVPRFQLEAGTGDLTCEGTIVARGAVPEAAAGGVRRRLEAMSIGTMEGSVGTALASILFRAHDSR